MRPHSLWITRLAHERTLMAWIRTTSLITWLYDLQILSIPRGKTGKNDGLIGPRGYGLFMIGIGFFALLLATISHRRDVRHSGIIMFRSTRWQP